MGEKCNVCGKIGHMGICIDLRDLNKVIKCEHYQIPTKEEVLAKMSGAKYFSKLDARSGFHQIKLDKKSLMMTTFNTPFGRYRHTRLPIGICSDPEVFQKTMTQCLEDLDILVGRGSTCLAYRDAQHKETILPHDWIKLPWVKVACDIFYLSGQPYVLTLYYYSHFPEVALPACPELPSLPACPSRVTSSTPAMYWPGMNADIDILVGTGSTCLTYRDAQHKKTILPHYWIEWPWAKVACDILYLSAIFTNTGLLQSLPRSGTACLPRAAQPACLPRAAQPACLP